jgi:hypothetical protein
MCTSDGPLQHETSDNQTITGHNHEKCLAQICMILSTTKVLQSVFTGFIDEGLDAGWLTSIGYGGKVLMTPKDWFKS